MADMLTVNQTARPGDAKGFQRMFAPDRLTLGVFFPIEAFAGDQPASSARPKSRRTGTPRWKWRRPACSNRSCNRAMSSVSSLSIGLANISWTAQKLLSAATGFVMISSIWWVYFDSFHLLTRQKLTTGHSVLYSHFFVFIGLSILASLIGHAIRDDMALADFRILSVIGAVCFFIGKQYAYFMECPELRPQLVVNTLVVFALSGLALLLPETGYVLLGLTCAVICYAFLSLKYLNVSARRRDHPHGSAVAGDQ